MCDYSLENVVSRPAVAADRLVTTSFPRTVSRGFADGAKGVDKTVAVCLRPGTEIAFDSPPVFEHPVTYQEVVAPGKVARFAQVDMHIRHKHHDTLVFADGTFVPVTRLVVGQYATVLQLPSVRLHERAHTAGEENSGAPARELKNA